MSAVVVISKVENSPAAERHATLSGMSSIPVLATSTPTENLAGLVERVTFHNEENGFRVLRFKARGLASDCFKSLHQLSVCGPTDANG